jgi:hypothetical protein
VHGNKTASATKGGEFLHYLSASLTFQDAFSSIELAIKNAAPVVQNTAYFSCNKSAVLPLLKGWNFVWRSIINEPTNFPWELFSFLSMTTVKHFFICNVFYTAEIYII